MFKIFFSLLLVLTTLNGFIRSENISQQEIDILEKLQKLLKDEGICLDEMLKEVEEEEEASQKQHIEQASLFNFEKQPDLKYNPEEMIRLRGYGYEAHHPVTEDCYILTMDRIVSH